MTSLCSVGETRVGYFPLAANTEKRKKQRDDVCYGVGKDKYALLTGR